MTVEYCLDVFSDNPLLRIFMLDIKNCIHHIFTTVTSIQLTTLITV